MKKMLKFIMPIWIAMVVNSLFGIIDYSFVRRISENYLAIIGIAYVPFSLLSSLIVGIGIESNRVTAKKAQLNFIQILSFSIISSTFLTLLAIRFSDYLLFFARQNAFYTQIKGYFNILSLLLIPTSIFYLCTGILRGNGSPEKSLYFNISSLVLNFMFDYIFIKMNMLKNPLNGCAIATVLSDSVVAAFYIVYIVKFRYAKFGEMRLYIFIKNVFVYSTEKLLSASTLELVSAIYISKISTSSSIIYFAVDKYFAPIVLLAHSHFEWIIFSKSQNIYYKSKRTYLGYFLFTVIFTIFIMYYLKLGYTGILYSLMYIVYCELFFIERSIFAGLFSKQKGNMVNLIVLIKGIFLIVILQIAFIFKHFNLFSFQLINCTLILIECLYVLVYSSRKLVITK